MPQRGFMVKQHGSSHALTVSRVTKDSPDIIDEDLAVAFDRDPNGNLALGLEGGHSVRRVVHAGGSATGRRVVRQLSALAVTHERIDVLEHTTATGLWVDDCRCVGVIARTSEGEARTML